MEPKSSSVVGGHHNSPPPGWRIGDLIAIVAMVTTAVIAVAGLIVSLQSLTKVEATRVEIGRFMSNSNGPEFGNPWVPWEGRLTDITTFVGVQRKVVFNKPFQNSPKVQVVFGGMDVAPLDLVMRDTGYVTADPTENRRLRDFHLASDAVDVTPTDFTLRVGIGLPRPSADHLLRYLETNPVNDDTLAIGRRFGQLDPNRVPSNQLTSQEQFMLNFYTTIGTFDITWVARADQK